MGFLATPPQTQHVPAAGMLDGLAALQIFHHPQVPVHHIHHDPVVRVGQLGLEGTLAVPAIVSRFLSYSLPTPTCLSANYNALGNLGVSVLVDQLAETTRGSVACVATSEDGGEQLWPPVVRGLELQGNGIGNGGFGVLQWYASKMPGMLKLDLEDNDITLDEPTPEVGLDTPLLRLLNSTHLTHLNLSYNPLRSCQVAQLFDTLDIPLRELKLDSCGLGMDVAFAAAAYLASERSHGLEALSMAENYLTLCGMTMMLDAVEASNLTLLSLSLDEHDSEGKIEATDSERRSGNRWTDAERQMCIRLPLVLVRNRRLHRRLAAAVKQALVPTRLILFGRPAHPPDTESGFRLLDLPREVQLLVARHCSDDAWAFSDAQWARFVAHAAEPARFRRLSDAMWNHTTTGRKNMLCSRQALDRAMNNWRRQAGCVSWEGGDGGDGDE
ncbi:hypothetical protein Q8F55_005839 [Vanrija albida]|uniref:F-box domain-containing protein n=1 Tax=Vanrija albida TaxID=181172 RepID=A0ABR3Q2Q3_9TREE